MVRLAPLPPPFAGPCPQIRRAWRYLDATHKSVNGLLDSFNQVRVAAGTARGSNHGRLRRDEVDLLRAALVFTSSGLDACCQQLVRDALPTLIDRGGTAELKFVAYLKDQLHEPKPPEGLLDAVTAMHPREQLVKRYIEAKTRASFQGSRDLKDRVRDLLGISNKALPTSRFTALNGFFVARNDIVHQLDYVNPRSTSMKRHPRTAADVTRECNAVLALVADTILACAGLLRGRPGTAPRE
ncbi:hypothetical protein [Umezawaea tangerina]|uniref:hypothetical protein n=1 Tax=Umezawaea tangerina TaxID=84725 RepID=UPI0011B1E741|nr:hypothetical protein [Umezawaea tangerina]